LKVLESKKILIIAMAAGFIFLGAGYFGYTQFFMSVNDIALKIEALDLTREYNSTNFTATITLKNTGKNDILNAELNYIFIKENDVIGSQQHFLTLPSNTLETFIAHFNAFSFDPASTYKVITTIC
jgi:hypothetical protein